MRRLRDRYNDKTPPMLFRHLSMKELVDITGLSVSTIYRMRHKGKFPSPVRRIQQCKLVFLEDEVIEALNARNIEKYGEPEEH